MLGQLRMKPDVQQKSSILQGPPITMVGIPSLEIQWGGRSRADLRLTCRFDTCIPYEDFHGVTWTGISTSECPGLVTMCNKLLCPFYPINGSGIPDTFDPTASHASS